MDREPASRSSTTSTDRLRSAAAKPRTYSPIPVAVPTVSCASSATFTVDRVPMREPSASRGSRACARVKYAAGGISIAVLPRNHPESGDRVGTRGVDVDGVCEKLRRAPPVAKQIGLICILNDVSLGERRKGYRRLEVALTRAAAMRAEARCPKLRARLVDSQAAPFANTPPRRRRDASRYERGALAAGARARMPRRDRGRPTPPRIGLLPRDRARQENTHCASATLPSINATRAKSSSRIGDAGSRSA